MSSSPKTSWQDTKPFLAKEDDDGVMLRYDFSYEMRVDKEKYTPEYVQALRNDLIECLENSVRYWKNLG